MSSNSTSSSSPTPSSSSSSSSNSNSSSSSSSSSSPPPPSSSSSSSSTPPPPSLSDKSPPPPSSSPPPPPSSDSSPPPPSSSDSSPPPPSQSPPPPDKDDGSSQSPPPPKDDDDGSSKSPPPPKNSKSPPSQSSNNNGNSNSPPPPPPPPPPPSPPGSSRHRPPPPSLYSSSDGTSSKDSSGSSNNSTAIIAGAVVGGGLLLILMIIVVVACCRKKKRKSHDEMIYFRDNSNGNKSSAYYNSGPHSNWNNGDHAVKIPQAPMPTHVSSEQWPAVPPPPPPAMSSSELSSAGFSGQVPLPPPHPSLALGFNQSTFTYEDLATATGGFAKAHLLGQGGFGYVHKGILPNGKEVAVKSLKSGSGQGEREFQAEVEIISRVHHRHLVSLVGYCIADAQRMLVYEFINNDTLEFHLHGKGRSVVDFPSRLKIALGSAKGFAYLHEDCHPKIIHRDIKASNILLDFNYEAKVADFGLAKLSNDNYTHVSTRIMGTFGYLAPEYAASGKLTEKSDVYSYGVVLLELITGRRPVDIHSDDDSLVDWARPILEDAIEGQEYEELVDPRLNNEYNPHEMLRMIACAAACIRHSAKRRPKMSQIVRALEGEVSLEALNEGMKNSSSQVFSSGSSDHDGSYNSEMRRARKPTSNGMSSQDFTSGEHVTGEFASHPSPLRSVGDSAEFIRKLKL